MTDRETLDRARMLFVGDTQGDKLAREVIAIAERHAKKAALWEEVADQKDKELADLRSQHVRATATGREPVQAVANQTAGGGLPTAGEPDEEPPMIREQQDILYALSKRGGQSRVDDLYADLRKSMRPLAFLRACAELYRAGLLHFGGGLPCARQGSAVIVVSKGVRYDLANGDWLIPGVSCQMVSVTGSKP